MFLEEITIRNVGLFRHSHTLKLAPPSPKQPIILIGGLNGSGKTTLLDAIQLALYGKRARLSNRGNLPYEEHLRRSINSGVAAHEEASVTLQFRQWSDGSEHTYRVRRAWTAANKSGVTEHLAVLRDGSLDRVLTETWPEYVEEILPVEISQLFFFDGEKIEGFAEQTGSTQLLAKAVHSLLGLDVVNRLSADLIALERRKQIALKTDVERRKIDEAKAELVALDERRKDLGDTRAAQQNDVDRRRKDLREAQEDYNKRGGALFDQREELESERGKRQEELRAVEENLRACAEGAAPLLLVQNLLSEMSEQHAREEQSAKAAVVGQVLTERDERLLTLMQSQRISDGALRNLRKFLDEDRTHRAESNAGVEPFLNLLPEGEQDLRSLRTFVLPQAQSSARELLHRADELQSSIVDLDRRLAGIPAQDLVVELIKKRDAAQTATSEAERRLAEIDAELKRLADEREQKHARLVAQIEKAVEGQFQAKDAGRIIHHSQRVRETVDKFRAAVVERHTSRISALVLDSFRRLLRKESLISNLKIDAETFALELAQKREQFIIQLCAKRNFVQLAN